MSIYVLWPTKDHLLSLKTNLGILLSFLAPFIEDHPEALDLDRNDSWGSVEPHLFLHCQQKVVYKCITTRLQVIFEKSYFLQEQINASSIKKKAVIPIAPIGWQEL